MSLLLPARFGSLWGSALAVPRRLRQQPARGDGAHADADRHDGAGDDPARALRIPDALYGGLLLYAFLDPLSPALRTAFDVASMPEPPIGAGPARTPSSPDPAAGKA